MLTSFINIKPADFARRPRKKQHTTAGLNYARAKWFLFYCAFYLLLCSGDNDVLFKWAQLKPETLCVILKNLSTRQNPENSTRKSFMWTSKMRIS